MTDARIIAELDQVGLRYGRAGAVLKGVNLTLIKGSFSFLTGASGAGKSTLLRLLYLRLAPTDGRLSLFGQEINALPPRKVQLMKRRIGVVSQDFDLITHLNVFQNVALPLRAAGKSRSSYLDDVTELLRWVGLGDRMSALPETLSGGERQRVAIARAVIAKPQFLIADEPTGNVDPAMGERLLRLVLEMNRGGTTVLIATHDKNLLSGFQDTTYHLDAGRLSRGAGL